MDISVNYLAVLVAAAASMAFGLLWYSPLVMGKKWTRLMGFSKEDIKKHGEGGMGKKLLAAFVAQFIMAFILAHLMTSFGSLGGVIGALNLAFWPWLGFVATVSLGQVLWEGKPMKLYKINVTHWFFAMFLMALILTFWR